MELTNPDPVLLPLLFRRRQLISTAHTRINAAVQAVTFLLDEETPDATSHGGSKPGKRANLERSFDETYEKLCSHYFSRQPLYSDDIFRRRFRMA